MIPYQMSPEDTDQLSYGTHQTFPKAVHLAHKERLQEAVSSLPDPNLECFFTFSLVSIGYVVKFPFSTALMKVEVDRLKQAFGEG
jgi:hypothetical protein